MFDKTASHMRAAFAVLLAVSLSACAGNTVQNARASLPPPDTTTASGAYEGATDYHVGAQDLLKITVFGIEDLDHTARVNSDGHISMPLIGSVMAGGKTIPELETVIGEKLQAGKFINDPHVSVFVEEYASQRVTVEGSVNKPGIYPITGRTSLLQAIAMAEGVDELANLGNVVIFRQVDGKRAAAVYDLGMVRSGAMDDPLIYGDDIVVVDQSGGKSAFRKLVQAIPALGVFRWY